MVCVMFLTAMVIAFVVGDVKSCGGDCGCVLYI